MALIVERIDPEVLSKKPFSRDGETYLPLQAIVYKVVDWPVQLYGACGGEVTTVPDDFVGDLTKRCIKDIDRSKIRKECIAYPRRRILYGPDWNAKDNNYLTISPISSKNGRFKVNTTISSFKSLEGDKPGMFFDAEYLLIESFLYINGSHDILRDRETEVLADVLGKEVKSKASYVCDADTAQPIELGVLISNPIKERQMKALKKVPTQLKRLRQMKDFRRMVKAKDLLLDDELKRASGVISENRKIIGELGYLHEISEVFNGIEDIWASIDTDYKTAVARLRETIESDDLLSEAMDLIAVPRD